MTTSPKKVAMKKGLQFSLFWRSLLSVTFPYQSAFSFLFSYISVIISAYCSFNLNIHLPCILLFQSQHYYTLLSHSYPDSLSAFVVAISVLYYTHSTKLQWTSFLLHPYYNCHTHLHNLLHPILSHHMHLLFNLYPLHVLMIAVLCWQNWEVIAVSYVHIHANTTSFLHFPSHPSYYLALATHSLHVLTHRTILKILLNLFSPTRPYTLSCSLYVLAKSILCPFVFSKKHYYLDLPYIHFSLFHLPHLFN